MGDVFFRVDGVQNDQTRRSAMPMTKDTETDTTMYTIVYNTINYIQVASSSVSSMVPNSSHAKEYTYFHGGGRTCSFRHSYYAT